MFILKGISQRKISAHIITGRVSGVQFSLGHQEWCPNLKNLLPRETLKPPLKLLRLRQYCYGCIPDIRKSQSGSHHHHRCDTRKTGACILEHNSLSITRKLEKRNWNTAAENFHISMTLPTSRKQSKWPHFHLNFPNLQRVDLFMGIN